MPQFNRLLAAATILSIAAGTALAQNTVVREGSGDRRNQLDKMELKPFPMDAFSKLSDWQNGRELSKGEVDGKVVLIVTYADWYPQAKRAFALAKRLSEKHASEGLIVVAAHHAEGWDTAPKPEAGKDASFLLAHDAGNGFRNQLMVDQDPDFYLIDRAGQLRYADITTESVEPAIAELLKEKADSAAGIRERLAADAARRDAEARRTEALRGQVDLTNLPEIEFEPPSPDAFEKAKWPPMPKKDNQQSGYGQGEFIPPTISFGDEGNWYPSKPNLEGRAVFMYIWHPVIRNTFFEIMPNADTLQRQFGRDVVVVGVLAVAETFGEVQLKDDQRDPEKLKEKMLEFARERNLQHHLYLDSDGSIFAAVQAARQEQGNKLPIPFVAVASSDLTLRWWIAEKAINVMAAVNEIMRVDPGIQARRAAERDYIQNRQK